MIDIRIIGDGKDCIYAYSFKRYLQMVADELKKEYKYQLQTLIQLTKTSAGFVDIIVTVFDSYIWIDSKGVKTKIEKFMYHSDTNYVIRNINPKCTDPIEIELAIVEMLLKLIYVIGDDKEIIETYTQCGRIIKSWTLNIQNINQYVYSMIDYLHYLDNLRAVLKTVTEPLLAEQMRALRKSAFLCYSIDFKSNIIEKACYAAIDMILDAADANFNIEFPKLDSFNIKVVQKKNYKANLKMEVELIPEEDPKNGDISDASFTVNYTDDLNNPLEIQDPSAAIASLLILFYNWYFSNIETYDGCNKEEMDSNFKDSIMTILPTSI